MNKAFLSYFQCPEIYGSFNLLGELSAEAGDFRFCLDTICYGRSSSAVCTQPVTRALFDAFRDARIERFTYSLPFNPADLVDNLRYERYVASNHADGYRGTLENLVRNAYYLVRPLLPVSVRKHLQRASLRDWGRIPFPSWPVDRTVDRILERLLVLSMKAHGVEKIPFIWFWPNGYSSCAMMTHDIETSTGLNFCSTLMDIDDSFGIKASFQIVPVGRYIVSDGTLDAIRNRGFEINVHDFNHDGRLFWDHDEFLSRASQINQYARQFGIKGFRSGGLYRNPDWYDAFAFSYDMSVPNVGHLDPQRGGCCTVMPYFIGRILELPLTTTQDYSLFYILGDYSVDLWQRQITLIREKHGLISFIVHPDYLIGKRAQNTYIALLAYLCQLRSEARVWIALPGDVDTWWRQRNRMKLVPDGGRWRIEGPGNERARIAWAMLAGERVSYTLDQVC